MARLVEFPSANGGSILVEVSETPGSVVTRGGGGQSEVFARAQHTFEEAIGRIQPAIQGVIDQLRFLPERPDQVSIEFGLELSAQLGAFIAGSSAGANFKVVLTWRGAAGPYAEVTTVFGPESLRFRAKGLFWP